MANGISLSLGRGDNIALNAEITFNIGEREEATAAHLSDVIYKLILEQLKEYSQAALDVGEYRLAMTVFVASIGDTVPQAQALEKRANEIVKEILPDEVPDSDD